MVQDHLKDMISKKFSLPSLDKFILRTTGIAESRLFEKLEKTLLKYDDISISFLPKITGVDLKLKIPIRPSDKHKRAVNLLEEIKSIAEKYIYTDTESDLPEIIGQLLSSRNLSLAIAESFTGGLISDWITNISGSSNYYQGSVITYSNAAKIAELGVKQYTLDDFGAVSEQTIKEMVLGVQNKFNTNCAIASTGIAGPDGGSREKPVGLCYLAARYNDKMIIKKFTFGKDRLINKERGAMAGLEALRRLILNIQ
jgi:nicotinamide-nucleotide amidase